MIIIVTDGAAVWTATAVACETIVAVQNDFLRSLESDMIGVFYDKSGGFAEPVEYTHAGDITRTYSGIVDLPSADASMLSDVTAALFKPQVAFRKMEMRKPPAKGDRVTTRGSRYRVDTFSDDGVGSTTVYMVRV